MIDKIIGFFVSMKNGQHRTIKYVLVLLIALLVALPPSIVTGRYYKCFARFIYTFGILLATAVHKEKNTKAKRMIAFFIIGAACIVLTFVFCENCETYIASEAAFYAGLELVTLLRRKDRSKAVDYGDANAQQ